MFEGRCRLDTLALTLHVLTVPPAKLFEHQ